MKSLNQFAFNLLAALALTDQSLLYASNNCLSCTTETSPLCHDLLSVTVIYLYTYPTLLVQLIPLLAQLFQIGQLRVVVTLTYHLHELPPPKSTNTAITTGMEKQQQQQQQQQQRHWTYQLDGVNETHDLCRYTHIAFHPATGSNDVTAMTQLSE